ncbi:CBU_0592 family membrane protein [Sediminicola sp. 1XM1-17]|uniref:CBU_0592 family membrane protein n=1 Tax=Sediminicola sp. 1XM1-17 TaxID=3127702 RepID=UPI00307763CD
MTTTDWIGAIGVFLILMGYFLNLRQLIKPTDLSYILLNLSGASIACFASLLLEYIPFIILEGIWALVSFMALINYIRKRTLSVNP